MESECVPCQYGEDGTFEPINLLSLKSAIHWSFVKIRPISKNVILVSRETNKKEKPPRQHITKLLLTFFTILTYQRNIVWVHIMKMTIFKKKPKM